MVYYYTSANVKMLRNIIIDYEVTDEISPYEYMKLYIEKCPTTTEDSKLGWIVETFLGIQKHKQFLKEITFPTCHELLEEDQDYFMIIFHAVTFQITPKDMSFLYKCIFNLSKPLLNTFTKFLCNNEVLIYISQVAQTSYDTNYITEKIVTPLFAWQPYISEMAHNYAEYVKRIETRRLKPSTVPIQPNVLNRKGKNADRPQNQPVLPTTPPNSIHTKSRRMLTRSAIDQKLKQAHEKNTQKASHLLNIAKNKNYHFAQLKSDKYYKLISNIKNETENSGKPFFKPKHKLVIKDPPSLPIKETNATIKRMNRRIHHNQEQEIEWLQNLMKNFRDTAKIEELQEHDRQENERQRLLDIERKHLMGQISYEEALIAKKKVQEDNKKKYEEFLKEREIWNEEIEKWKRIQMEKNRKQIEKLSLAELNLLQIKNSLVTKKKEAADKLRKENETMLAKAIKDKQKELERKVNIIKEIQILSIIAKKSKVPKIIDLTETSGLGLLCEMSIAELQERLTMMKVGLKEELERKKELIMDEKAIAKQKLEDQIAYNNNYKAEKASLRNRNKNPNVILDVASSKDINNLKKILDEKRKLRINMTN